MKKRKRISLIIIAVLVVAFIGARVAAHMAASDYGRAFKASFALVSARGFADTPTVREFFATPQMSGPLNRMRALSLVGGHYRARADELQRGVIYLSEQMALPPNQRYVSPPAFSYLTFAASDNSDSSVAEAVMRLLASYESQL